MMQLVPRGSGLAARRTLLGEVLYRALAGNGWGGHQGMAAALYVGCTHRTPARLVAWLVFSGCRTRSHLKAALVSRSLASSYMKPVAYSTLELLQSLLRADVPRELLGATLDGVKHLSCVELLLLALASLNAVRITDRRLSSIVPAPQPKPPFGMTSARLVKLSWLLYPQDPFGIYIPCLAAQAQREHMPPAELVQLLRLTQRQIREIEVELHRVHGEA